MALRYNEVTTAVTYGTAIKYFHSFNAVDESWTNSGSVKKAMLNQCCVCLPVCPCSNLTQIVEHNFIQNKFSSVNPSDHYAAEKKLNWTNHGI